MEKTELNTQIRRIIDEGKWKFIEYLKEGLKEKGIKYVLIDPLARDASNAVIRNKLSIEDYLSKNNDEDTLFAMYSFLTNTSIQGGDVDFIIDISKNKKFIDAICHCYSNCNTFTANDIDELHIAVSKFISYDYNAEKCIYSKAYRMLTLLIVLSYIDDSNKFILLDSLWTDKLFKVTFKENDERDLKRCLHMVYSLSRFHSIHYSIIKNDDDTLSLTVY